MDEFEGIKSSKSLNPFKSALAKKGSFNKPAPSSSPLSIPRSVNTDDKKSNISLEGGQGINENVDGTLSTTDQSSRAVFQGSGAISRNSPLGKLRSFRGNTFSGNGSSSSLSSFSPSNGAPPVLIAKKASLIKVPVLDDVESVNESSASNSSRASSAGGRRHSFQLGSSITGIDQSFNFGHFRDPNNTTSSSKSKENISRTENDYSSISSQSGGGVSLLVTQVASQLENDKTNDQQNLSPSSSNLQRAKSSSLPDSVPTVGDPGTYLSSSRRSVSQQELSMVSNEINPSIDESSEHISAKSGRIDSLGSFSSFAGNLNKNENEILKTPADERLDYFGDFISKVPTSSGSAYKDQRSTSSLKKDQQNKLSTNSLQRFNSGNQSSLFANDSNASLNSNATYSASTTSKVQQNSNKKAPKIHPTKLSEVRTSSVNSFRSSVSRLYKGKEQALPSKLRDDSNALEQALSRNGSLISPEGGSSKSRTSLYSIDALAGKVSFVTISTRGVFTLNTENFTIMTANSASHSLLFYGESELLGTPFIDLLHDRRSRLLVESGFMKASCGTESGVIFDGTLLDLKTKTQTFRTLSCWMKVVVKKSTNGTFSRLLVVVVENVDEISGQMTVDINTEQIVSIDNPLKKLFMLEGAVISSSKLSSLIPSIPVDLLKEVMNSNNSTDTWFYATTSSINDMYVFPVIVRIAEDEKESSTSNVNSGNPLNIPKITMFTEDEVAESNTETVTLQINCLVHMGGMLTVNQKGLIETGNDTFLTTMFGFHLSDLVDKPVNELIVDFDKIMLQACKYENAPMDLKAADTVSSDDQSNNSQTEISNFTRSGAFKSSSRSNSYNSGAARAYSYQNDNVQSILSGSFEMTCQHYDGGCFKIICQIKETPRSEDLDDFVYTLWITLAEGPLEACFKLFAQESDLSTGRAMSYFAIAENSASDSVGSRILMNWNNGSISQDNLKSDGASTNGNSLVFLKKSTADFSSSASGSNLNDSLRNIDGISFVAPISNRDDLLQLYDLGRTLGQGTYGSVYHAVEKARGKEVSIKMILKSKLIKEFLDERYKNIPKEIVTLQACSHANIIKFIQAYECPENMLIVMEYFGDSMDLFQFIDEHPQMPEDLASKLFRQIASALHYCHSLKIAHRDIKEENVLINSNLEVKLIDFGSATMLTGPQGINEEFKIFFGTLEYAAPEILSGKAYKGLQNDVWALGITLFSMIYTENAFMDVEETLSGTLNPPFEASSSVQELIQGMLNIDPDQRFDMEKVINHPWLLQSVT